MSPLDHINKTSGIVTAELDEDLLEIESLMNGAAAQVEVDVLGTTYVFAALDDYWERWVEKNADEIMTSEGLMRYSKTARVAASLVGIRRGDRLKTVVEMFKMPPKVEEGEDPIHPSIRALYESGNPLRREDWARNQLLSWLSSGSSREGRSAMNGDFVEKLYMYGARKAQNQQQERLGKLDPFFMLRPLMSSIETEQSSPEGSTDGSNEPSSLPSTKNP